MSSELDPVSSNFIQRLPARRFPPPVRLCVGNINEAVIAFRLVLQLERVPCLPQ